MRQEEIVIAFKSLGRLFASMKQDDSIIGNTELNNKWYTPDSQLKAIKYWSEQLNSPNIETWISSYTFAETPKKVGLIMAGNIPLVGMHDLASIMLSGHKCYLKTSSDDQVLTPWIIKKLIEIDPRFNDRIEVVEKLNSCDAIIATGSNNSSRYFEYYFKDLDKIIRKNRNSLAILTGNETEEELISLSHDIFSYFGLGCRNVSKLMVPENYDFNLFFKAIEPYHWLIHHNKYYNNYTYHKALFLMNIEQHLDNGFLLLKNDEKLASPLGCLFYSYYMERNEIIEYLDINRDNIQIVVGNPIFISECIPFGNSQNPKLSEYADGIDTMLFLSRL